MLNFEIIFENARLFKIKPVSLHHESNEAFFKARGRSRIKKRSDKKMKNQIAKSKTQAISLAHGLLRVALKTNRLTNVITSNKSCLCDCGETQAVTISAGKFEKQETVTVGYCKHCGE